MGIFQIEFRPDDLPETRALDHHVRARLESVVAQGLPVGFEELLLLSTALRCYTDTFVCLDVEEYCAKVVETAGRLLSCAGCGEDPVLAALAATAPDTPVATVFGSAVAAGLDVAG